MCVQLIFKMFKIVKYKSWMFSDRSLVEYMFTLSPFILDILEIYVKFELYVDADFFFYSSPKN